MKFLHTSATGAISAAQAGHGMRARLLALALIITLAGQSLLMAGTALAQRGEAPVIIRDTETERVMKGWAVDVIRAADLDPEAVNLVLIKDSSINAFVAGGPNIFFHTGLIRESANPGEVIGVLAHELGHIRGGHLVRTRSAARQASFQAMLGMLLGLGAAAATGEGAAAATIGTGVQSMAMRGFLAHTRVEESAADQAALKYLDRAGYDPEGLLTFMEKLESEELLPASQQSAYVRTHPLTRDRIATLRNAVQSGAYPDKPFPQEWQDQHARVKAKLIGYLHPEQVPWHYDDTDRSVPARYARAIADYRKDRIEEALAGINALIGREPDNPYFHEIKGQMLVDFGRVEEALGAYERAAELVPDAALIRIALAHALIESAGRNTAREKTRLNEALKHLKAALGREGNNPRLHRLLATAYGRLDKQPLTRLHLAEEAFLKRRLDYARSQAEAALQKLPEDSPEWVRARDILHFTQNRIEDKKNK